MIEELAREQEWRRVRNPHRRVAGIGRLTPRSLKQVLANLLVQCAEVSRQRDPAADRNRRVWRYPGMASPHLPRLLYPRQRRRLRHALCGEAVSEYFSASTGPKSMRARASAWRSSTALFPVTADACGPMRRWTAAPRSFSRSPARTPRGSPTQASAYIGASIFARRSHCPFQSEF